MTIKLKRAGEGAYVTPDGRFTVSPITMGDGVTGWAGGRGWSNGHREWMVTDTTGEATLSQYGKNTAVVGTLYAARDLIKAHSKETT